MTSGEGGTVTVPLTTSGPFTAPDPPVAVVTATPARPIAGQPVRLDATGSLDAASFEWTVVSSPAGAEAFTLQGATPAFTPSRAGRYEISVVAVGDSGRSALTTVAVDVVSGTLTVTARAGVNQTVRRGATVTLDGSASVGTSSYAWQQVPNTAGGTIRADQVVALSDPAAAKPTFTLPAMALPAAPGPNPAYSTVGTTPLRFRLTVTGVDGTATSTATTVVRPQVETLAGVTARYRTRGEWRVSGTTDVLAGQKVAVVLGSRLNAAGAPTAASARGRMIGIATADAAGAWSYVGTGPNPQAAATAAATVTVVSAAGGQVVTPITVTG